MSYKQLGSALASGKVTVSRLKDYYTSARKKATSRQYGVQKRNKGQFGEISEETFTKLKNITTDDQLLREIHDVNKYLRSAKSTITGLKKQRATLEECFSDFDINDDNYPDFIEFLRWFEKSEFVNVLDSDQPELAEAFEMAEAPTPEEWQRALEEITARRGENS